MFGRFCGPTVTSIVFYFGGPILAFSFSSTTLIICYFVFDKYIILPEDDEIKTSEQKENFFTSFEKFDIIMLFFAQLINVISKTFYGPLIFNHVVKKFNISLEYASNLFSLSFLTYWVAIYYIDNIIKNYGTKMTIAFGLLTNFVAINFLSPISVLPQ